MSLTGKLEAFDIASLLQFVCFGHKTGVLKVNDGKDTVQIFVKNGLVIYATSSQQAFRLGHFLRSRGIISEAKLRECLQLAEERNQQLGKVLVEEGYTSKSSLQNILHLQAKEILYALLLWETGDAEYRDAPINVKGKMFMPLNPMNIILEASRQIDERSIINREIPSEQLIFKISEKMGDTKEVKLNKNEWRVLSLMDGNRTVQQVINDSGYDKFSTYKIIYSLKMSGFIEKTGEKESDSINFQEIINLYNNIFRTVYKALEPELGSMVFMLFAESKAQLLPEQQNLLQDFALGADDASNKQALLETINKSPDRNQGRMLLTQSLNALLKNIIHKETDILGSKIAQSTLDEIEQILSYVKEYQRDSTEKIKTVYEIETFLQESLNETQNKTQNKKKTKK